MDETEVRPDIEMFRSESKNIFLFAGINVADMTKAELLIVASELGHMYTKEIGHSRRIARELFT